MLQLYVFCYTDGTSIAFEMTEDDFQRVSTGLFEGWRYVRITTGVISLESVRSVILQKDQPKDDHGAEPNLTPEEVDWLKSMKLAETVLDADEDDGVDYEGGMTP